MLETLLNIDPSVLLAFVIAGFLLNITPGADFLLVSSSGIRGGVVVGLAAGAGVCTGVALHIAMAVAGVSALLIAYPPAYDVILYLGAAYLLWMAWQIWFDDGHLGEGDAALGLGVAYRRGFLTNILNPKTALFIFAFIPQFTDLAAGPLWQQILIFGLVFLFQGILFDIVLATTAGYLGPMLRRYIGILNTLTAILFVGLAARLVLQ